MASAEPIAVSSSVSAQAPVTAAATGDDDGLSFHEILSDLNPLQYMPVVGTIYRAVTGDTIPRPLREVGSLVFSGLTGGPVGVATNLAMLAFEKLSGIDLDDVEQKVFTTLVSTPRPELSDTLLQSAAVEGAGAPTKAAVAAAATQQALPPAVAAASSASATAPAGHRHNSPLTGLPKGKTGSCTGVRSAAPMC
jgi:hypothetical protein